MKLTTEQLQQFNDDGFLVVENVFSSDEIDALFKACNECKEVQTHLKAEHGGFKFHLLEITTKHPAFLHAVKSQKIVDLIEPLIGEDIQLQHSKLAVKNSGSGKGAVSWHQDFAYLPHTNTSLVSVMIAMDDLTPENGAMIAVRGSYKLGLLNHLDSEGFIGDCKESSAWADPSKLVQINPKKGGISIHHCLTLHSSPDNFSGKPRHAIIYQYRACDAFQLADGIWADTGVQISGTYKGLVRCEPLNIKLPRTKHLRYGAEYPYGHAWNQVGAMAKADLFSVSNTKAN